MSSLQVNAQPRDEMEILFCPRPDQVVEKSGWAVPVWWNGVSELGARRTAALGYPQPKLQSKGAGLRDILEEATALLKTKGYDVVVAPLQQNTWYPYRLPIDGDSGESFFGDVCAWPELVQALESTGYGVLHRYVSKVDDNLDDALSSLQARTSLLDTSRISFRSLSAHSFEQELGAVFKLVSNSFSGHPLFSEISEEKFFETYAPLVLRCNTELIRLAWHGDSLVGFLLSYPFQERTIVVKTLCVESGREYAGMGTCLLLDCYRVAQALGCTSYIHALMREGNLACNMSSERAKVYKRYAVWSKEV